jgi:hypothetical protein
MVVCFELREVKWRRSNVGISNSVVVTHMEITLLVQHEAQRESSGTMKGYTTLAREGRVPEEMR